MPIAYAAHTESCTFLLDDEGICRQVIRRAAGMSGPPPAADSVNRCIGAQYVASIDVATQGGLVAMPQTGAPLLFAYVGQDGRIALVRTGALLRFETQTRHEERRADESIEVEVNVDPPDEEMEDPTHLFRRAPAAAVRAIRVLDPLDSAPTLDRERLDLEPATRRRGVLPARRRA